MMKTPILNWRGKRVLWLGTSIPAQGCGVDSYPELFGRIMGCEVTNMAWPGSHATWDINEPDEACATNWNCVKGLSATTAELNAKIASAQQGSAYLPTCQAATNIPQMSYEYRIGTGYDVVFLDHNHNDRVIDPAQRDAKAGTLNGTDKATIYGAWNFLITQIQARNPNAKIILMTAPTVWKNGVDNGSFQHINGLIHNIGQNWGLPVYDLTADLNLSNEDTYTFLGDGTHPTTYEQRYVIAKHIAKWACGGVMAASSASWIPTLYNTTNVSSSSAFTCSYSLVDGVLNFFGQVNIKPASVGIVLLGMSLPFPIDLIAYSQASGIGLCDVTGQEFNISADVINNRLSVGFNAASTGNQAFFFVGSARL